MICKKCGAIVNDSALKCPCCGEVISDEQETLNNTNEVSQPETPNEEVISDNDSVSVSPESASDMASESGENEENMLESVSTDDNSDNNNFSCTTDTFDNTKPTAKKHKALKIIISSLIIIALLAAVFFSVYGVRSKVTSFFRDVFSAGSGSSVVAEYDNHKLTNQALAYYYNDIYDYFSPYLSSILDPSLPLSEQYYSEDVTWQDYIIKASIEQWKTTNVLIDLANREGFELDEESNKIIDSIEDDLKDEAENAGFTSEEDYLRDKFGKYATVDSYKSYNADEIFAYSYYLSVYNDYVVKYSEDTTVPVDNYDVSVRHILIAPENADDEGSWNKAAEKVDSVYKEWKSGDATEDTFAALAQKYSEDPGSSDNGGLYENVYEGQMVDTFNDWCFNYSREYGDSGIVKTEYGYHIMFFVAKVTPNAEERASESLDRWLSENVESVTVKMNIANADLN